MQTKDCRTSVRIWPESFALASSTHRYNSKKETPHRFSQQRRKNEPRSAERIFLCTCLQRCAKQQRQRLLFSASGRATSARRRQDVRPCGNGRSCPFLPPARAAASSPRRALPPPLRRLTRAPLFRTLGFAGRAMAMPVRSSPAPPHGFVRELFNLRLFQGPESSLPTVLPPPKRPRSPDTGSSAAPRLHQVQERS